MRFQKLGVALATAVFVSGCTAGRQASVRMTEDVNVPPTHRSQYAPEYPSRATDDYDSNPETVPSRPLPSNLRGPVKSVSRPRPVDRQASTITPAPSRNRSGNSGPELPIREVGLIRRHVSRDSTETCSSERSGLSEGCHGQPAGTSFCHRLHLLFHPDCPCRAYDPWAFCGTMTFEESQAAGRFGQPWSVPTPEPTFAPDLFQPRPAPVVPESGAGGRRPDVPEVPPIPDQEPAPEMQPDESLFPEPMPETGETTNPDVIVPKQPAGGDEQNAAPGDQTPAIPEPTPPKEGEFVEPPPWFRKKKQPADSSRTSTESEDVPTDSTTPDAAKPALPNASSELESLDLPEEQEPQKAPPKRPTPIGPTALPTPLRQAPRPGVARYPSL